MQCSESLVIHEKIAEEALPVICDRLSAKGVEIRGDEAARQIDERIAWAQESDWGQEAHYHEKVCDLWKWTNSRIRRLTGKNLHFII